jgi:hypothetical protein
MVILAVYQKLKARIVQQIIKNSHFFRTCIDTYTDIYVHSNDQLEEFSQKTRARRKRHPKVNSVNINDMTWMPNIKPYNQRVINQ